MLNYDKQSSLSKEIHYKISLGVESRRTFIEETDSMLVWTSDQLSRLFFLGLSLNELEEFIYFCGIESTIAVYLCTFYSVIIFLLCNYCIHSSCSLFLYSYYLSLCLYFYIIISLWYKHIKNRYIWLVHVIYLNYNRFYYTCIILKYNTIRNVAYFKMEYGIFFAYFIPLHYS